MLAVRFHVDVLHCLRIYKESSIVMYMILLRKGVNKKKWGGGGKII